MYKVLAKITTLLLKISNNYTTLKDLKDTKQNTRNAAINVDQF